MKCTVSKIFYTVAQETVGALLRKYSYVAGRCRYAPLTIRVSWIGVRSISRRLDGSRVRCIFHWCTTAGIVTCIQNIDTVIAHSFQSYGRPNKPYTRSQKFEPLIADAWIKRITRGRGKVANPLVQTIKNEYKISLMNCQAVFKP